MSFSEKPPVGTVISTVIADLKYPASVCVHSLAHRPMVTIIPVEHEPYWILSIWGNGPGIACFLIDWNGKPYYDVEVVRVGNKSLIARPLPPDFTEFYQVNDEPKREFNSMIGATNEME